MLIVQKFGGTSVGSLERIKASCEIVKSELAKGNFAVVIVSAMAGKTDSLTELYAKICDGKAENQAMVAEKDVILASGEQVSAGLFSAYLNAIGVKARSFNGLQAGIFTDAKFTNAKIEEVALTEVLSALNQGITPIITGFQGYSLAENRQTTLGRGGSDTSAIAIASALNADICEIYKDVEGVLTGDPKITHNVRKIERLNYHSMLEIASSGAKVLELRSVNFGAKYAIPIHVRSSFEGKTGTFILGTKVSENAKIEAISVFQKDFLCKIAITKELSAHINELNEELIAYKIATIDEKFITALLPESEVGKLKFASQEKVSQISISGFFLKSDNVLERAIKTLENLDFKPLFTTISETKITFFLKEQEITEIVNQLHTTFLI
jgi:aspartate kinase